MTWKPEPQSLSPDEQQFLADLLAELAEDEPAVRDALIASNPNLEQLLEMDGLRNRVRDALTGQADATLAPEQMRAIQQARASWAARRTWASRSATGADTDEPNGILTSMTRDLPPEKAIELYRKIIPIFVYEVLRELDQSASLGVVNLLVDHLCCDETQRRLRECEHVRDGILDEFRSVLGRSEIRKELSRDDLQRVLEACGAMNDLVAMEECIKLARTKAG